MKRTVQYIVTPIVVLLLWPALVAAAETLKVSESLALRYSVPEGWQASTSAPEFLIRQTVDHVSFHMREGGKPVPPNLEKMVRERMANNELFLFNPETRAHLDIDFSGLDAGDPAPGPKVIATSADYAEQELHNEADLTEVETRSARYELPGTVAAFRIDASYLRDGEPRRFVGIIGYAERYWIFLYYTDEAQQDADLQKLEEVLAGLELVTP